MPVAGGGGKGADLGALPSHCPADADQEEGKERSFGSWERDRVSDRPESLTPKTDMASCCVSLRPGEGLTFRAVTRVGAQYLFGLGAVYLVA